MTFSSKVCGASCSVATFCRPWKKLSNSACAGDEGFTATHSIASTENERMHLFVLVVLALLTG